MVNSIQNVAQIIGEAGDNVSDLEQQSNQVNVIVDVIRDIADQTNLLALNAAIEAARQVNQGEVLLLLRMKSEHLQGVPKIRPVKSQASSKNFNQ